MQRNALYSNGIKERNKNKWRLCLAEPDRDSFLYSVQSNPSIMNNHSSPTGLGGVAWCTALHGWLPYMRHISHTAATPSSAVIILITVATVVVTLNLCSMQNAIIIWYILSLACIPEYSVLRTPYTLPHTVVKAIITPSLTVGCLRHPTANKLCRQVL